MDPPALDCLNPAVFGIKQRKVVNFCAQFILLWQRQVDKNNLNFNVHNTFCKADFVPQSFPYFMGAAHPTSSQSTYTQYSTQNCRVLSQSLLKLEKLDKIYIGPLLTRIGKKSRYAKFAKVGIFKDSTKAKIPHFSLHTLKIS